MLLNACLALCCMLSIPASAQGATPSDALITNQAQAAYSVNYETKTVLSNQDVFIANPALSHPSISLYRYVGSAAADKALTVSSTGYSTSGSATDPFTPLAAPTLDPSSAGLDLSAPLGLISSALFHAGDPIFIEVDASDQNLRPNAADTITLAITSSTGDTELLRLTETGPNTGVFAGYIQTVLTTGAAAISYDGKLTVSDSSTITARYQDSLNQTDIVTAAAAVDPTGRVFNSITGLPIDGVSVTLMNAATGKPADVKDDFNAAGFPANVATGSHPTVNGHTYDFVPGEYRFPLVAVGRYRLVVTPPPGYRLPAAMDGKALQSYLDALQKLSGAPYSLSSASVGQEFSVDPGPILHIDIPLDPVTKGLWMEKSSAKTSAAVGDFVPFRLRLTNLDANHAATGVVVTDRLPHGLRYQPGSLRLGGVAAGDPAISADGLTLSFALGTVATTAAIDISYVTQVVAGAGTGSVIVNSAWALATGVTSNSASASVAITEDFFTSRSFLMGTVTAGACGADGSGIEGVRIYLENGSYVISDKKGMFHFEGVRPGTHVMQLDLDSLPEGYQVLPCQENSRFAGRSFSQFVDLQGGAMWRVDFRVGKVQRKERAQEDAAPVPVPPGNAVSLDLLGVTGKGGGSESEELSSKSASGSSLSSQAEVGLELTSALKGTLVEYQARMWGGPVPLDNLRLAVTLPAGVVFEANSSQLDTTPLADPVAAAGNLIYQLGGTPGDWTKTVRFRAAIDRSVKEGGLLTRARLTVDTPTGADQSTPVAVNLLSAVQEENRITLPEIVLYPHFSSFDAELSAEDRSELDELAILLKVLDIDRFTVTGHTDNVRIAPRSRGVYTDNKVLSLARAKRVGRYLMDKLGLPPSKLDLFGRGESMPVASNRNDKGRALNRRVEIRVQTVKRTEKTRHDLVKSDSGVQKTAVSGPSTALVAAAGAATDVTILPAAALLKLSGTALNGAVTITPEAASLTPVPAVGLHLAAAVPALAVPEGAAVLPISAVTETAAGEQPEETVAVPVQAEAVQVAPDGKASGPETDDEQMPSFDMAWIENVQAGREWVWPPAVYFPPIPSTHIALKHSPDDKVTLKVNGEEVHPVLLEKVLKSPNGTVAVSYWRGVPLLEGDNSVVAILKPADGSEATTIDRLLHVSTSPVRAEIVPELSTLVADGKHAPVVALRLFDKDDYPIRNGMTGKFAVSSPFESYVDAEKTKLNDLAAKEETKYVISKDGVAFIKLQPTNRTGEAIITIPYANNREEQYRAWLTPKQRDWILVGLAEGTAGYNTASGHLENLRAGGSEEQFYDNGRVALFAKGSIQGKWLLTMAYDSAKKSPGANSSLFGSIDPNSFYTLYGDNTQQQYDAASVKKLYLKIERSQFYAVFGDFNTGLTVTELSRYSRTLNGLKSEYQGKDYEFNVFASETAQSFAKDEIRGDGTSGLYRLSRKNILINSEKIAVEVRDRFRSEVVISSRTLTRYLDYSIDYDNATLFFKEPISSRDENFNPVYIVADYETQAAGSAAFNYGGRVGVKFLDEKVKTGATYIREEQFTGKGNSYGLDASWQLTAGTKIKAEVARTDSDFAGLAKEGNAYLAELEHRSAKFEAKLYYRELGEGFGLGQQSGSEAGTRKVGADAGYKLTDAVALNGQAYRQYNLATGGVRDLVEAKGAYSFLDYGARLGLRHASDTLGDGSVHTSEQLTTGVSWLTLNKKLALHVDHDQSIGGNSNADFPTRTSLGADYKISSKTTLFGQQEFTSGAGASTNSTRLGLKANPWEGGMANSSVERSLNENSERVFALFGLKQVWKLSEHWSVDTGMDRSQTIKSAQSYSVNVNIPPASGTSENFTAVSAGTTYVEKKWNWSSRVEYRTAASEEKWGVQTSFVGEPLEGWGWSARFQLFDSETSAGMNKSNGDLRLGLAYRPSLTRWILLDRLDVLFDRQQGQSTDLDSRRIVNNLNANFSPDKKTQVSLQYGAKYALETIDSTDYSGYTDLVGIEGRYDLTKVWDIGLRGSILHSWGAGVFSYSAGPSVGYNVMQNAWVSLGYNIAGFKDKDFSAGDYTAQGPFVRFRFKFDQNSLLEAAKWINQH